MKSLFLLFVVVAYFATGEALKCYGCDNPPDEGCGVSQFDKNAHGVRQDICSAGASCVKMISKKNSTNHMNISLDSEFRTSRGCMTNLDKLRKAAEGFGNDFLHEAPPESYFCDTDLCNGASSVTAALSTLMAVAMLLMFRNY